ncbi:tetratricopeptide repeat protein [Streptomyces lavendulae]|uniref:tetratricopeptide repeat protein n=1 Tax=Streptomyces lavendulae TaxID=1914 RepID=UPI003321C4DF
MLHPLIREINAVALTAETSDLAVWHQALAERLTTAAPEANQRGRAGWPAAVRHTLNDRTRVLGPEHPHTLASRDSLGLAVDRMGEHAQAVRMHRSTLDDRTRIPSSAEHPDTLASRHNLALALTSAGEQSQAINLLRRTIDDRVRILGDEHPHTLSTRNALETALAMSTQRPQSRWWHWRRRRNVAAGGGASR